MNIRIVLLFSVILAIYAQPTASQTIWDSINSTFSTIGNLQVFFIDSITSFQSREIFRSLWSWPRFLLDSNIFYFINELVDITPSNYQEYDFIVVGAGSAGSALAARLSENENATVLLIEAGGNELLLMDVPLFAPVLRNIPSINWNYLTEPSDKYCRGKKAGSCTATMGKVLGGSSTVNFMIALRGHKDDYDEWAELTGNQSWSYDGMLHYFKKLENFDYNQTEVDPEYHNFDGPIRITSPPFRTRLGKAFIQAGREMGFSETDHNGKNQTGFSYIQSNQINGERLSSNRAYLHPIKGRENLFLSCHSQVTKVLIHPENKTAYGVEFVKSGETIQVRAKKEVILSSSAIGSAKILMLSGIGPAEHLKSLDIDLVRDAPVGENMMDHVGYGGLTFLVNDTVGIVSTSLIKQAKISEYVNKRTGPLTIPGGVEAMGLVNVDDLSPDNDRPNMELLFSSASPLSFSLVQSEFGLEDEEYQKVLKKNTHQHAWTVLPLLLRPKSRGKLLLNSNDPLDKPKLIPNYFSDPEDVRVAVKGIRLAIEVSRQQAFQRYDSKLLNVTIPGCDSYELDSDDYWECALRTHTFTVWHHSGTCKMGKTDDKTAVVDPELKVIGVSGLRVVDTSIMPNIPAAHTNIPTIAIAEKAADMIKSEWGYI